MILDRIFGTEERSGLKQPAGWLSELFATGSNYSGVTVNESNAMQLSAVASAVNVISNGIASQALRPFSKKAEVTNLAQDHATYKLLSKRANDHMSAFTFIQLLQSHALRWGNGFAWIDWGQTGKPKALWPLNPSATQLLSKNGRLIVDTLIDGKQFSFPYEQIIHIKALGSDGLNGVSPIRQHAEELGIQIAAQNFGAEFFGNGATVQGVIQHPGKLTEEARKAIKDSWSNAFSGSGNRHKTPVLPDGMDYKRVGIPPEEAQFLETRKYGDTKIAQIYNVPPHMIGDLSKATFSNITEETMNFVRRTLNPWFVQWEQELDYKLFSTIEQNRLFVKFDKADILKGTPKEEAEKDVSLINGGILTRNEARTARGLNPIDGLDEILVPLNMVEMSEAVKAQEPEPEPEPEPERQPEPEPEPEAQEQNSIDFGPLVHRFAEQLTNAEKGVSKKDQLLKWRNGDASKFIERHLKPLAKSLNKPAVLDEFTRQYNDIVLKAGLLLDEQMIARTLESLINETDEGGLFRLTDDEQRRLAIAEAQKLYPELSKEAIEGLVNES